MKKGFLLSLDAVAAISLLLTVSLFLAGISFTYASPELRYQRYYYAGKDLANILEETEMQAVSDVVNLSDYGLTDEDMDRTILDVIGSFWAEGNKSYAENLTKEIFENVLNNTGLSYEVLFDGDSIYASGPESPDFLSRLATIVSGYEKTKPVNGYLARVYLTKVSKSNSYFSYFGGYVGEGNVTKIIPLPVDANVTKVYMEMNIGNNFTLYVNGNFSGNYNRTAVNFSADNWTVCSETVSPSFCPYFTGGNNTVEINFTENMTNYIGGGYLKVTYKTSELTEGEYVYTGDTRIGKYYFPGIRGIINLYSSFYVPGTLNNISARLHYYNNLSMDNQGIPVYFFIGAEEIYRSNETGEQDVYINDSTISNIFGGMPNLVSSLSNATIPIRFGTEPFAFIGGESTSDSVLITDISGSMNTCDVESVCTPGICDDSPPCYRRRINVARDVDKEFVNTILNYTGSRAGLVSYNLTISETHILSDNQTSLESQIDRYVQGGSTCISCGIAEATSMLMNSTKVFETKIQSKSSWLYNTSYPSSDPPNDANGTSWTEHNYTDSGWNGGDAILGFGGVDTDIGNNNGNYYFRKHFNMSDVGSIDFGELFVLSDDNAEVYLNGYLIDNDTEEHNATYWNRGGQVLFYDDFEGYYGPGPYQVDGNDLYSSPGYWFIDDTGEEVYMMCEQLGYPSRGADVLIFRDMDSYGYAETHLNLSGQKNLTFSYWWRMGYRTFGGNEYSDMWIWDGNWNKVREYNNSYFYGPNLFERIDLSGYNMVDNFTIRFGSRSSRDEERFYVDDVKISKKSVTVDKSYFRNGDNVIAVKLRNNDSDKAEFDLELNVTKKRYKAMLVMSDGSPNYCIPGVDCTNAEATNESIEKACEARDDHGITVYSVAFGNGANMTTLRKIACWDCSAGDWITDCDKFYNSSNAEELEEIYQDIAEDIANATYEAQVFNISGNISLDNVLHTDSFISFNYTPVVRTLEYGELTLGFESPRLRQSTGETLITDNVTGTKEGWFIIPSNTEVVTKVLDSKMTSYSSYYWTDRLWVNSSNTPNQNWTRVYWLGNFSDDYEELGDPYIIQIPPNLLKPGGNNSFKIGTGLYPLPMSGGLGGSPDDRVIYTVGITGISLIEYSEILPKAEGSSPTIYYDTNGDNIPESSMVVQVGSNPSDIFDPENDSIDSGFMKLINAMNFINDLNEGVVDINHTSSGPSGTGDGSFNNPIDLEITEEVEFMSDFISQIPSMWGPATMEVRVWG